MSSFWKVTSSQAEKKVYARLDAHVQRKRQGQDVTLVVTGRLGGIVFRCDLVQGTITYPRTDGYVVNNHGDRFRTLRIVLFPFQMGPFHGL